MTSLSKSNNKACRAVASLILVMFTFGCTTMQPVYGTDREMLSRQISIGDTVEIVQQDGEVVKFKVDEMSESGLGGEGSFVAYPDIQRVRIAHGSKKAGNFGLRLVAAVVVVVLAVKLLEDNLTPGLPSN